MPVAPAVVGNLVELVALAVGATTQAQEASRGTARQAMVNSLVNHIGLHIADPDLNPNKAAAYFGVSTRYIHKVLADGDQTFGKIVLEKRLERCAIELATAPRTALYL